MKHHTCITRERPGIDGSEEEIPITVEYSFEKPSGDGWNEPRDPGGYILEYADDANGNEVVLTKAEIADICDELSEAKEPQDA